MLAISSNARLNRHEFPSPFKGRRQIFINEAFFIHFLINFLNLVDCFIDVDLGLLTLVHLEADFFLGNSFGASVLLSCAIFRSQFFNCEDILFFKGVKQFFSSFLCVILEFVHFFDSFILLFFHLFCYFFKHFLVPIYLLFRVLPSVPEHF